MGNYAERTEAPLFIEWGRSPCSRNRRRLWTFKVPWAYSGAYSLVGAIYGVNGGSMGAILYESYTEFFGFPQSTAGGRISVVLGC